MFPHTRRNQIFGAIFLALVVVSTLHGQEPTPTPTQATPTPVPCEWCTQQISEEIVTTRRFIVILGGAWMGWQVCVLLYRWV
jgi:hypothetical protein